MVTIPQMQAVRRALQDAHLPTPFTGRVKRGFSIKLTSGKPDTLVMNEYMTTLIKRAEEATKDFDNIEIRRTRARSYDRGGNHVQINVVVRVVTPA